MELLIYMSGTVPSLSDPLNQLSCEGKSQNIPWVKGNDVVFMKGLQQLSCFQLRDAQGGIGNALNLVFLT